jgi:hypothetical protein
VKEPRTPETGAAGEMNNERLEMQGISGNIENENEYVYDTSAVPDSVIETLAREFLPQLSEFYSKEENRKAFEEWIRKRDGK